MAPSGSDRMGWDETDGRAWLSLHHTARPGVRQSSIRHHAPRPSSKIPDPSIERKGRSRRNMSVAVAMRRASCRFRHDLRYSSMDVSHRTARSERQERTPPGGGDTVEMSNQVEAAMATMRKSLGILVAIPLSLVLAGP